MYGVLISMKNVDQTRNAVPTRSRPNSVASEGERSRILRRFLVVLLRFLRRKRALGTVDGNLSSWILAMHGMVETSDGRVHQAHCTSVYPSMVAWVNQLLGPDLDPRKIKEATLQSQKIGEAFGRTLEHPSRQDNQDDLEREFSKAALRVMDAWGAPREFSEGFEFSLKPVLQLLRALRATLFCIDRHHVHPIVLIVRASTGSQQAVLDLVKVDKLFLHDSCTLTVLRKAELKNDQAFMNSLGRAQEYQPILKSRTVRHAYYSVLFLLEQVGVTLPTLHELWRTMDPQGREYESLSAFEKDFQRRRLDFNDLLATLQAEMPLGPEE